VGVGVALDREIGFGVAGSNIENVENWVYSAETVRKSESDRIGARECKVLYGPRNLLDSFFEGRVVRKN